MSMRYENSKPRTVGQPQPSQEEQTIILIKLVGIVGSIFVLLDAMKKTYNFFSAIMKGSFSVSSILTYPVQMVIDHDFFRVGINLCNNAASIPSVPLLVAEGMKQNLNGGLNKINSVFISFFS